MKGDFFTFLNKRLSLIFSLGVFILFTPVYSSAQTNAPSYKLSKFQTWQLLDYQQDTVYGTSVNKAYKELLKGKISHPVIVAVIDAGVDINHEDLQGHIWTNKKEIEGNGIDDDKNGYTDDIHGWNFMGGKGGKMIYATNSEADREYARLLPEFALIKDSTQLTHQKDYAYFQKIRNKHLQDSIGRNENAYPVVDEIIHQLSAADSLLQRAMKKHVIYYADIESFKPTDNPEDTTRKLLMDVYAMASPRLQAASLTDFIAEAKEYLKALKEYQSLYKDVRSDPFELRKEIVGDNPYDINDKNYGNNVVGDRYAEHGTHCSGIISAIRDNGKGMDGIADNVIIMPVRATNTISHGDEMDKDVALAIRYAVDNGAKIISMSFAKTISPQKQWVDDAIKYAEKKGVLLVHAAGNNHENTDSVSFYPNADFLNSPERAKNFITVGSITINTGLTLVAEDSNYGSKTVDLFAPGVDIYSTIPGNKYKFMSGTSMATPVVAGVAALILEYYPDLTAEQLKDILVRSVTSLKGKMVYKPGTKDEVDFSTLCSSGGVVNAYNALHLASKISTTKK